MFSALALAMLAGSQGCGPALTAVEGRVTLDGDPLDEAAILFVPLDTERRKTGGLIQRGEYQLTATDGLLPGRYRVEVIDSPPLHATPEQVSGRRRFPFRYANESPLVVDVTGEAVARGTLRFNFELTSNP